ncbi:MAG: sulfatase-like hydrolase/transferase [Chloroflexi bacterium]|nr:sulfatase-like hydrolase/transferase [Chloroflexota bacterium]
MPDRQPNIVLIITDHHAYFNHDRPGEFALRLPTFDRLCAEGVCFERAYSISPICTPARASMMTGLYPSAHGLRWNTDGGNPQRLTDFRPGQLLYSHYLSRAGYRNAYAGKWHCGRDRLPLDYGIEGWSLPDYGKPYMSEAYREYAAARGLGEAQARIEHSVNHPEWEGQTLVLHDPSPWRFMNCSGVLEGPPESHEAFFTAHLAIEQLRELAQRDQPFSLVASFWGPHQPYYPTEPFASLYDPKSIPEYPTFRDAYAGNRPLRHFMQRDLHHGSAARWPDWATWQEILARCYGQIQQTDAAIGQILEALDALGLAENTLVLWCADHGDAIASHGGLWDKASTYHEEVARIPFVVRWPAAFAGGQRTAGLVSNMDVTATMLAAAGVAVPESFHSRSVLPLCHDPAGAAWPEHVVCEHNGHGEDILQRIIVGGRYKYVAALYDTDELYDLEADPHELRNLVDEPEYAGVGRERRQRLIEHIRRTNDRLARHLLYALQLGT